jgi:hypothetical protein
MPPLLFHPPATRTLPLPSRVAVGPERAVLMGAADDQELLAGSYDSAPDRGP